VSWGGVDKAQAALLTYSINHSNLSFFKVDNSFLTGIGYEEIAVSEGRYYGNILFGPGAKKFHDLAQATVVFYQGNIRGLNASGWDQVTQEIIPPPDEPEWSAYILDERISWQIVTPPWGDGSDDYYSVFDGYYEQYTTFNGRTERTDRQFYYDESGFSYTLVNTEAEPVPEPLTAGAAALGLAGLSWLKHNTVQLRAMLCLKQ
jgi:hypothetical protein